MPLRKPLARVSRIVSRLSAAGAVLVPVATVSGFLWPEWARRIGLDLDHHGLSHLTEQVPLWDRLLACACAMVPAAIATVGLIALTRLLHLYSRGDVFGREPLAALGRITVALFWNVIAAFVMEAPITYFLTRHGPHAELQLTIQSGDLGILFLAAVALVISRAMAEARRLADENAAFV